MLQTKGQKKIVLVAGSASASGLDREMLERETGYQVVNVGLHAGFCHLFGSGQGKENINAGDIVLLGYEYGWERNLGSLGKGFALAGADGGLGMYLHIPPKGWKGFIGHIMGDARPGYRDKAGVYGTVSVVDEDGDAAISEGSIEYLKSLKEYVEEKGAKVYFVSPPVQYGSIACGTEGFLKLAELEEREVGIPYISDPMLYMFPIELMPDAMYRCNNEGGKMRTDILIDDLKLCGALEEEPASQVQKEEKGEPFALVDTLPKRFLHKPKQVDGVYRVDRTGAVTTYQEGVDYIVDYARGTIRRTPDSSMPNYKSHQVFYSDGKFEWIDDSGVYNPESNRDYQILADYKHYASEGELAPVLDQSHLLSKKLKEKIKGGEGIEVALCGDSIGAGADTDGKGIFLNYLAETLESYYNIEVKTSQYSLGGAGREQLLAKVNEIVAAHPDVLMIEFGMNDHCGEDSLKDGRLEGYKADIESTVGHLQNNGIDVVLIGFFQQNALWDAENTEATRSYNAALQEIAQNKNVYFADVYHIFELVGYRKQLYADVLSDYIHHPNEWGHKLYFTSLLEAFHLDGGMRPADIANYVYVGKADAPRPAAGHVG